MTVEAATEFRYRDIAIEVRAGVFQPNKTTELLLDAVLQHDLAGKAALDLGCGSGVVGTVIRKLSKVGSMHGSDISPAAVANARANAARLGLDIELREGSLFEPWQGQTFDVIIDDVAAVADPFARLSPWYPPEIVCDAGVDGTINTIRMLERAGDHLAPGGVLFFPTVSLSNEVKILEAARSKFGKVECVLKKSWPFREDFWARISQSEVCRKLIDEGVVKVAQRGSRWLWDTSIYLAHVAP